MLNIWKICEHERTLKGTLTLQESENYSEN